MVFRRTFCHESTGRSCQLSRDSWVTKPAQSSFLLLAE
jgi:hypothetical protein